MSRVVPVSANRLRAEVHARQLQAAAEHVHEVGWSRAASVIFGAGDGGDHGNFLPASYKRILARPAWARRLEKAYTAAEHLPRRYDRRRGELECASSSDALLMNVFCYPGMLRRAAFCGVLGVEMGVQPEFGVRANLAMRRGEVDRTEFDMRLGDVFAEAKLTEGGFGSASRERVLRYLAAEECFDVEALPMVSRGVGGYQLIRGLLAAVAQHGTYLVLVDARRQDLVEVCLRVLRAAQSAEVRSRLRLRTWQELAAAVPPVVQGFLAERYGILPD